MPIRPATTASAGQRLGDVLRVLGLTQREAAKQIGVSQGLLSRIIRGEKPVSLDWLWRAAESLDCDPHALDPRFKSRTRNQVSKSRRTA